jgi:hypothetical protein
MMGLARLKQPPTRDGFDEPTIKNAAAAMPVGNFSFLRTIGNCDSSKSMDMPRWRPRTFEGGVL